MLKTALDAMKNHTPRLVTGKNYVAAMVLELDLETRMFINKQDFQRYWQLKKEGAIDS